MKFNLVYITAKDKSEAKKIGQVLLEEKLAACVNITEGMSSLYWWEGEIQEDDEAVLIAKTKESLVKELIAKVKLMHSYDCPCIVSLPVLDGNPDYLNWLNNQTK